MANEHEMDNLTAFAVATLGVLAALIFSAAVWFALAMLPGLVGG